METETRSFPELDIRVSDAERDHAVTELSEHFQAGRLTRDEFDDRSGRALAARTGADLSTLFADLPLTGLRRELVPPQAAFSGAEQVFTPGEPSHPNFLPVARVAIALVIAAIIAGGLFGGHGPHPRIGLLVPAAICALACLRLACRRR